MNESNFLGYGVVVYGVAWHGKYWLQPPQQKKNNLSCMRVEETR